MFDKINVWTIIKDHLNTLNCKTGKLYKRDTFVFFFIPVVLSVLLSIYQSKPSEPLLNALITAFSIFAGLLFNLLVIIYSIISREEPSGFKPVKIRFVTEIYSNISFGVLLSFFNIILLFLTMLFLGFLSKNGILSFISSFITYYSVILFLLTLLMTLKRVHILLATEIKGLKVNE